MPFEITFKKNLFSSTRFYIDEDKVCFDGKEILIPNITGFSYYVQQSTRMSLKVGKSFLVYIYEKDTRNPHKLVGLYAFDGGSGNGNFSDIFRNLWHYIGDKQLKDLHEKLLNGEEVFLNQYLLVTPEGAYTSSPGLFRMKKLKKFTFWHEMHTLLPPEESTSPNDMDYFKVINTSTNKTVGKYHIGWNNIRLFDMYVNWLNGSPEQLEALAVSQK